MSLFSEADGHGLSACLMVDYARVFGFATVGHTGSIFLDMLILMLEP